MPPRRGCECPKNFTHDMILRLYTVMHNWKRLLIYMITEYLHNNSAERKAGLGGTDRAVSLTWACKC